MFTLRIEFLTGRSVSSSYNDRQQAEWPPHPARVFSAFVEAWAAADPPAEDERHALEWLERSGAPDLAFSEASSRDAVTHFVPVNDTALPSDRTAPASAAAAAVTLLPERRNRQARHFPSVTPENPVVHLSWAVEPPAEVRFALDRLAARVVRIGHSSSLVACVWKSEAPEPNLIPDTAGDHVLRVPGEGQLASLEEEYGRHQGVEPRVLPCRFQRYRANSGAPPPAAPVSVLGDDWIVFRRVGGPRLPTIRSVDLAAALRGALLLHAVDPPPPALSGHEADGKPVERPHAAFVPLPFVAHEHADGSLLGIAVVLPRDLPREERRAVLAAVGRFEASERKDADEETPALPLLLGRAGKLEVERVAWGPPPLAGLRPGTWCRAARRWASATPVALDRNPGDLGRGGRDRQVKAWRLAEEAVALACERIGLPRPARVLAASAGSLHGTQSAHAFPPFPPDPRKTRRVKIHARIEFAEPVRGPILLGAGRYFGLGLFRPVDSEVSP